MTLAPSSAVDMFDWPNNDNLPHHILQKWRFYVATGLTTKSLVEFTVKGVHGIDKRSVHNDVYKAWRQQVACGSYEGSLLEFNRYVSSLRRGSRTFPVLGVQRLADLVVEDGPEDRKLPPSSQIDMEGWVPEDRTSWGVSPL